MRVTGVRLSLWRAAAGYRVVSAAVCLYLIARWRDLYERPLVAEAVGAGVVLVTALVVILGMSGRAHRRWFAFTDLAVTIVLTLLTPLAQTGAQAHGGMPTLTTAWAAGPVIEVGLVTGWFGGLLAAVAQTLASIVVREGYDGRTLSNGLLLMLAGTVAGYIATRALKDEQHTAADAARVAATAERDRITRDIHDGVLQVLGLMHRKGLEAGGEWVELGRAAGEQEAALRALITSQAIRQSAAGIRNLSADLAMMRTSTLTVSVPDVPVEVSTYRANQILDIVRAAMQNVDQHAGPQARTWILLEDLGSRVAVSVRDDGVGFAPGRLEEAAAAGRLGVAQSISGRAHDLGGTVAITSSPGAGTEIEIVVPKEAPA